MRLAAFIHGNMESILVNWSDFARSLGTLSAGLGHDMANVLVPMRVCLTALTAEETTPQTLPLITALRRAVGHLEGLAKGLRALAMDPESSASSHHSTVLSEWWSSAISPFTWALPQGVRLHVRGLGPKDPPLPPVRVPAHALMQAVFNLVQNAGQALGKRNQRTQSNGSPAGGNIWIGAELIKPDARGTAKVRLVVRDDGPGMDAATLSRCTDAFFTTKAKDQGIGLGLFLVRSAVERHGGTLIIESKVGEGSTLR